MTRSSTPPPRPYRSRTSASMVAGTRASVAGAIPFSVARRANSGSMAATAIGRTSLDAGSDRTGRMVTVVDAARVVAPREADWRGSPFPSTSCVCGAAHAGAGDRGMLRTGADRPSSTSAATGAASPAAAQSSSMSGHRKSDRLNGSIAHHGDGKRGSAGDLSPRGASGHHREQHSDRDAPDRKRAAHRCGARCGRTGGHRRSGSSRSRADVGRSPSARCDTRRDPARGASREDRSVLSHAGFLRTDRSLDPSRGPAWPRDRDGSRRAQAFQASALGGRRILRPVVIGPGLLLVRRIDAEIEDVVLREAQMFDDLPQRVGSAVRLHSTQRFGESFTAPVEVDMRVMPSEEADQLRPQSSIVHIEFLQIHGSHPVFDLLAPERTRCAHSFPS